MKRNPQSIALIITSIGCLVFLCLYISAQSRLNQFLNFIPSPEAIAESQKAMKEGESKLAEQTKEINDRMAEDNAKIQALTRH